jgi:hypothetical protein
MVKVGRVAGQHGKQQARDAVIKVGEGRIGACRDYRHSDLRRDGKGGQEGTSRHAPDNPLSQMCTLRGLVCAGLPVAASHRHATPGPLRTSRAASHGLFAINHPDKINCWSNKTIKNMTISAVTLPQEHPRPTQALCGGTVSVHPAAATKHLTQHRTPTSTPPFCAREQFPPNGKR